MKQGQRLNLTCSVADTDQIKQLCGGGRMSDQQIVVWFRRNRGCAITAAEVRRVCADASQFVRVDSRRQ